MIHINLNMIFYTDVEHSPTKTIKVLYKTKQKIQFKNIIIHCIYSVAACQVRLTQVYRRGSVMTDWSLTQVIVVVSVCDARSSVQRLTDSLLILIFLSCVSCNSVIIYI